MYNGLYSMLSSVPWSVGIVCEISCIGASASQDIFLLLLCLEGWSKLER